MRKAKDILDTLIGCVDDKIGCRTCSQEGERSSVVMCRSLYDEIVAKLESYDMWERAVKNGNNVTGQKSSG